MALTRERRPARVRRVLIAALLGNLLLLVGMPGPAQAAETDWINFGGDARTYSAVYSVTINGATYDVGRGVDNNVWFRYNGGSWRPLGGDNSTRTTSPPRIVEWPPGRAMVFVRGLDGEIWYSQVNSGSANFWEPWTRLPTGARAIGSPLVSPTVSGTGGLFIQVPNEYRVLSYDFLYHNNGVVQRPLGWTINNHAILSTDHPDIEGNSQIAVYGTEHYASVYRSFVTGTDNHVWRVTTTSTGARSVTEVNGGAVCESGVAAARLGNQTAVVGPGQAGYANQQRVLIACVGTDGLVWNSTSSDGGYTFDGWRRPAGTPAPSHTTPAVNATVNSWTLTLRWNAALSSAFPDNSVIAKRIS